jgi:hypothetical protein
MPLRPRQTLPEAPISSALSLASFYPPLAPLGWVGNAWTLAGWHPDPSNGTAHRILVARGENLIDSAKRARAAVKGFWER